MADRPFLRRPKLARSSFPHAALLAFLALGGCAIPGGETDVGESETPLAAATSYDFEGLCATSQHYTRYDYGQAPEQTGIVYAATCKTDTAPGNIVRLDLKTNSSSIIASYEADRTVTFRETGPDFAVWTTFKRLTTTTSETTIVFHDPRRGPPKSVDTRVLTGNPSAASGPGVYFAAYAGEGRALVAWSVGTDWIMMGVLDIDSQSLVWKTPRMSASHIDYATTADRSRFMVLSGYRLYSNAPLVIDKVTTQPVPKVLDSRLVGDLPWSWEGEWAPFNGKRVLMRHTTEGWTLVDLDTQQRTPLGGVRTSQYGYPFPDARAADDGSLALATTDGANGSLRLVPARGAASAPMPLSAYTRDLLYVAPNADFALIREGKVDGVSGTTTPKIVSFVPGQPPQTVFEDEHIDTLRVEQPEGGPPFVIVGLYSPTRTLVAPIGPAGKLGPATTLPYSDAELLDATHVLANRCVVPLDPGTPTTVCLNADETLFDLKVGGRSFLGRSFGPFAPDPWHSGPDPMHTIRYRLLNY